MKNWVKTWLFGFFIGAVIFSSIGVVAYSLSAKDISFTPNNSNWQVDNINDAINDLYKSGGGDIEVLLQNGYSYTFTEDYSKIIVVASYHSYFQRTYDTKNLDNYIDKWVLGGKDYAVDIYTYTNVKIGASVTLGGSTERGMAIFGIK